MAVIRVNKTEDYSVISNYHFREKGMSLKAKGLLSMMLSLPDNWDYSIAGLVTLSKDGKDSVMYALMELEHFGYLRRTRKTDEKGRFSGYDYDIYEKPQQGEPYAEKPNTDNPPQLNTNKSITKESNTKEKKKVSKQNSFDGIIDRYLSPDGKSVRFQDHAERKELLQEWLKVRKAKRAAMTDRAIEMNINKLDNMASQSGMTVVEYLEEVICRGWAAFYVINNYSKNNNNNKQEEKKEPKRYGGTYL